MKQPEKQDLPIADLVQQIQNLVQQMQNLPGGMSSIFEKMEEQKQLMETINNRLIKLEEKLEEKERLEKERLERERLEKERLERERLERERLERERLEREEREEVLKGFRERAEKAASETQKIAERWKVTDAVNAAQIAKDQENKAKKTTSVKEAKEAAEKAEHQLVIVRKAEEEARKKAGKSTKDSTRRFVLSGNFRR